MPEHEGAPVGSRLAHIRQQVNEMLPTLREELTHDHGEARVVAAAMAALLDRFPDPLLMSALTAVIFIDLAKDRAEVIRIRAEIDQRQMELRALRAENDRLQAQLAKAKTLFIYGPGTTEIESSDQDGE